MRFITDLKKGILGRPDSPELWQEIVSLIPDSVFLKEDLKILSPAVGHGTEADVLVKRMRSLGLSIDDIKSKIFLLDKYSVFTKALKRKGYTNCITADYTTWETDQKFDIILCSPPFQNPHGVNSHALWEDFVKKAHTQIADNGYIAMITPYVGRRKIKSKFFENDFLHFKSEGVSDYFKNSGSTFCYHVVRQGKTGALTTIGFNKYDLSKYGFVPSHMDEKIEEILEYLMNGVPLDIQNGGIHSSNDEVFSTNQNEKFPYRYQHSSSQTKWGSKPCPAMTHTYKVVCSKSGYLNPWLDVDDNVGVTENSWIIPVESEEHGQKIIAFLNSPEVKLFNEISGSNTSAHDPNKYKLLHMPKKLLA